jgi:hypothetical protein
MTSAAFYALQWPRGKFACVNMIMERDNANRRIPVSHQYPSSWGFEPGSLVKGSKQVFHWTSETW